MHHFRQVFFWSLICTTGLCVPLYEQLDPFQLMFNNSNELFSSFIVTESNELGEKNYRSQDAETTMTVFEIIRYHGYPAEEHQITTDDGYVLTVQRIPYGKAGPGDKPRQPVIVQHGFLCSSAIWVINTPERNLGYVLADAGYDVWLTNIRGNSYGRRHIKMKASERKFWEFSFQEMSQYDMPAMIDFVLSKTGFSKINYIGHSMGTTIAFTMLSIRPEYNDKINLVAALAPAISLQHMTSAMKLLKPFRNSLEFFINILGGPEIPGNNKLIQFLSTSVCVSPISEICHSLLFIMCGFNENQLNTSRLPVYMSHTPSSTSLQNLMHFLQRIEPGLRWYDYGKAKNMEKYGQPIPPSMDMSKVTAPVAIFSSDNDILADPVDVAELAQQVSNLVLKYRVPDSKFNHVDFMWAIDVNKLLYNKVIEVMQKVTKN